jgi:hypothetical protein
MCSNTSTAEVGSSRRRVVRDDAIHEQVTVLTDRGREEARCGLVKLLPASPSRIKRQVQSTGSTTVEQSGKLEVSKQRAHRSLSTVNNSPPMMGSSRKYSLSWSLYVADLTRDNRLQSESQEPGWHKPVVNAQSDDERVVHCTHGALFAHDVPCGSERKLTAEWQRGTQAMSTIVVYLAVPWQQFALC